mmetsp:Transcript_16955/g.56208  ORF Transcript_16955/g.56208 Transcript_16955/m.56208 type:complete len:250 (-) Transcript_16955:335-1084(-)
MYRGRKLVAPLHVGRAELPPQVLSGQDGLVQRRVLLVDASGQRLDDRLVMRTREEGDGEAGRRGGGAAGGRLHHAVDGGAPPAVGPHLVQVSDVDDEAAAHGLEGVPVPGAELDLQPARAFLAQVALVLREEREAGVVGVLAVSDGGGGLLRGGEGGVVGEPQRHLGVRRVEALKVVCRQAERGGGELVQAAEDSEQLAVVGRGRLVEASRRRRGGGRLEDEGLHQVGRRRRARPGAAAAIAAVRVPRA